jgi:two-component system, OmpR family, alkaline phosphatase synthesis response regulator PhoP
MPNPLPIVLADDDAHITCVVAMRLEGAGFAVTATRDGEEAFEAARQVRPVLVITDLQMPRMSGLELAIKLREHPDTRDIPVIMLTARGYLADESQMSRTNIKRVLPKPFSVKEVLKLATEVIAECGSGPSSEGAAAA